MIKKKKIVIIISVIILLVFTFIITDYIRTKNNQKPIFSILVVNKKDKQYLGLGYKIIKCNNFIENKSMHIGFYNLDVNDICEYDFIDNIVDNMVCNDGKCVFDKDVDSTLLKNMNLEKILAYFIKRKFNNDFNIDDYIIDETESESISETERIITKMHQYTLKINNARINVGYTTAVENNKIIEIYDHMRGYKVETLKKEIGPIITERSKNLTEERLTKMRKKALDTGKILNERYFYNIDENKLYYNILIEETDSSGAKWAPVLSEEL